MYGFLFGIGGPEMVVILVIGLIIYGRRLPEVGAQIGRTVVKLKRGLNDFKAQLREDESFKEVTSSMREFKDTLKEVDAPRITASPGRLLQDLTDEVRSSVIPEDFLGDEGEPESAPRKEREAGTSEAQSGP